MGVTNVSDILKQGSMDLVALRPRGAPGHALKLAQPQVLKADHGAPIWEVPGPQQGGGLGGGLRGGVLAMSSDQAARWTVSGATFSQVGAGEGDSCRWWCPSVLCSPVVGTAVPRALLVMGSCPAAQRVCGGPAGDLKTGARRAESPSPEEHYNPAWSLRMVQGSWAR